MPGCAYTTEPWPGPLVLSTPQKFRLTWPQAVGLGPELFILPHWVSLALGVSCSCLSTQSQWDKMKPTYGSQFPNMASVWPTSLPRKQSHGLGCSHSQAVVACGIHCSVPRVCFSREACGVTLPHLVSGDAILSHYHLGATKKCSLLPPFSVFSSFSPWPLNLSLDPSRNPKIHAFLNSFMSL